jgi:hypothetical protein
MIVENILGFDISVYDAFSVQIGDGMEHLRNQLGAKIWLLLLQYAVAIVGRDQGH